MVSVLAGRCVVMRPADVDCRGLCVMCPLELWYMGFGCALTLGWLEGLEIQLG